MFITAEMVLDVGFTAARARLTNLAHSGGLEYASGDAYGEWNTTAARVGPGLGLSRLVRVQFLDVASQQDAAIWALRWEVSGAGGALFPVLDADIKLTPYDESGTMLALAGAYRPPLGAAMDRVVLRRTATATVRHFVTSIGDAIAHPAGAPAWEGHVLEAPSWPRPAPETFSF